MGAGVSHEFSAELALEAFTLTKPKNIATEHTEITERSKLAHETQH
jgi:hypothetical protein